MENKKDLYFEDGLPEALVCWLVFGLGAVVVALTGYILGYYLIAMLYYVFTLSNWSAQFSGHTATLLVVWVVRFWIVIVLPAALWYAWWERRPRRKRKEKPFIPYQEEDQL